MDEIFNLSGKKAIVTGAGSGIGRAIAHRLADSGADVILLDRNEQEGQKAADEITDKGQQAWFYLCDISDHREVEGVFKEVLGERALDILVNNAGIAHVGNVENTSVEDFDRIYRVNVGGVFNCIKAGLPFMKGKGGSIINMSSVAALTGIPDRFAYSTSKGAVHTMTLSVAKDYLSYNIRCNSIAPARIHTPFVDGFLAKNYPGSEKEMFDRLAKTQPIGRMGTPEEVAALVNYLVSDEASFITGTSYPIDGGFITLNN